MWTRIRRSRRKGTARLFVLFARNDDSYDESFAGVALTRAQEKAMGQCVDRSGITCWTEEARLRGWKGPLDVEHHPEVVYLVFSGGHAQGSDPSSAEFDPELKAACATRGLAEKEVIRRMRNDESSIVVKEWHIWEASFGRVLAGANNRGEVQVSMDGVRY